MKFFKIVLPMLFVLLLNQSVLAVNASDVAVIDLSVALCLHPKMALFDFNRIGFYKVELGLKEEEFKKKTEELRNSAPNFSNEIYELERERVKVSASISDLYYKLELADSAEKSKYEKIIKEQEENEKVISRKIHSLEHQTYNYDLTSPEETKEIAAQIEKEIFEAINEVAEEKHFSIVLNNTNPCPMTYQKNYTNSEVYGQGIPGMDFMLFYSFLAKNNLQNPWDDTPPSRDVINWMELTRYPVAMNILPMQPYPLVLSGGKSILSDVLKKIYNKYNVDSSVSQVVESVVVKMEQLQNGQKVEQKLRKYDN